MDTQTIDKIIDKHHGEASSLIQILLEIQSKNHWLPKEALVRVGKRLDVPLSQIQHITTFYKSFSLVPKGRHREMSISSQVPMKPTTEIFFGSSARTLASGSERTS